MTAFENRRRRSGRPKKERIPVDTGTPELVAKRAFAAGGGDPALATTPLGILFARKLIDTDQYEAGQRFAWLRAVALGVGPIRAQSGEAVPSWCREEDRGDITKKFNLARTYLFNCHPRIAEVVYSVLIWEEVPAWALRTVRLFDESNICAMAELECLRYGLSILGWCFGYSPAPAPSRKVLPIIVNERINRK